MRHIALLIPLFLIACGKKKEENVSAEAPPAATDTPAAGSSAPAAPTPAPTPTPEPAAPPPAPVAMTAEELKPSCTKIFTPEIATKTFGADTVKQEGAEGKRLALCQMSKGTESLGSVTIACNPDLDTALIERERAAMTKAKDLPAKLGRGGYRISNSFVINDDETPCRLMINMMNPPADEAQQVEVLRAILAAVNPAALK